MNMSSLSFLSPVVRYFDGQLLRYPFFIFLPEDNDDKAISWRTFASLDRFAHEWYLRPGMVVSSVVTQFDPVLMRKALEGRVEARYLEIFICLHGGSEIIFGVLEATSPLNLLDNFVELHQGADIWYPDNEVALRDKVIEALLGGYDKILRLQRRWA